MVRLSAIVALAVALGAFAAGSLALAGTAGHPQLVGVVGKDNAYKISLSYRGKVATTLKAGTYTVVVHDDSTFHNYELDGPHGRSWTFTSVPFTGTKTFTLKLVPGAYKAYCAPHESSMFQHFTVR